jgi:hypothetical protein
MVANMQVGENHDVEAFDKEGQLWVAMQKMVVTSYAKLL